MVSFPTISVVADSEVSVSPFSSRTVGLWFVDSLLSSVSTPTGPVSRLTLEVEVLLPSSSSVLCPLRGPSSLCTVSGHVCTVPRTALRHEGTYTD